MKIGYNRIENANYFKNELKNNLLLSILCPFPYIDILFPLKKDYIPNHHLHFYYHQKIPPILMAFSKNFLPEGLDSMS